MKCNLVLIQITVEDLLFGQHIDIIGPRFEGVFIQLHGLLLYKGRK